MCVETLKIMRETKNNKKPEADDQTMKTIESMTDSFKSNYDKLHEVRNEIESSGQEMLREVTDLVNETMSEILTKHKQSIRAKYEDYIMNVEVEAATQEIQRMEMKKQLDRKISHIAKEKNSMKSKNEELQFDLQQRVVTQGKLRLEMRSLEQQLNELTKKNNELQRKNNILQAVLERKSAMKGEEIKKVNNGNNGSKQELSLKHKPNNSTLNKSTSVSTKPNLSSVPTKQNLSSVPTKQNLPSASIKQKSTSVSTKQKSTSVSIKQKPTSVSTKQKPKSSKIQKNFQICSCRSVVHFVKLCVFVVLLCFSLVSTVFYNSSGRFNFIKKQLFQLNFLKRSKRNLMKEREPFIDKAEMFMSPSFRNVEDISQKKVIRSHKSWVFALDTFVKSGMNYLVTGSYMDKNINIWNPTTSTPNKSTADITLTSSSNVETVVTFQIDGKPFMACAGYYNSDIEVWDLTSNKIQFILKGHSKNIDALTTFEDNGKVFLISGSLDESIKIWDISSSTCISTLQGHTGTVISFAVFHKNGKKFLASGSFDKTLKLWDLDNMSLVTTLTGHTDSVRGIEIFYKENVPYLASGGDKTIKVWNLTNYQIEATLKGNSYGVTSLTTFLVRGKTPCLASGGWDSSIKLFDLENYSYLRTLNVPESTTTYSLTTYDDKTTDTFYLVSGHYDGSIILWSDFPS